jgi:hypothetical protein
MNKMILGLLLLVGNVPVLTQNAVRANFSGDWVLDKSQSRLQIPMPDSTVFHVEHNERFFKLTRTHVMKGQSDTLTIDLRTDGEETVLKRPEEIVYSRCHWEGEKLVFESRVVREGGEGTNVVKYSLSPDGLMLVANERFEGPALKYENAWIFLRAPTGKNP